MIATSNCIRFYMNYVQTCRDWSYSLRCKWQSCIVTLRNNNVTFGGFWLLRRVCIMTQHICIYLRRGVSSLQRISPDHRKTTVKRRWSVQNTMYLRCRVASPQRISPDHRKTAVKRCWSVQNTMYLCHSVASLQCISYDSCNADKTALQVRTTSDFTWIMFRHVVTEVTVYVVNGNRV